MIPFTQYLMPDGRKREGGFERPADVEALAHRMLEAGLVFECEVLGNGLVSLTVTDPTGDEGAPVDLDGEVTANNASIGAAVDRLIRRAALASEEEP